MCDMRERGVATDRGKGPEFGNEVGMHGFQDGLILSPAKCLVMKDRSCPSAISHSLSLCSLAEVQLPQPI
jgi:hypothetical protein